MTDAEIMKGVKLCNGDLGNCKECPFDSIGKTCGIELAKAEIGLIERLQAENAALRERLEKALKLREPRITVDHWGGLYEVVYEKVQVVSEFYETRSEAKARLAELKGGER